MPANGCVLRLIGEARTGFARNSSAEMSADQRFILPFAASSVRAVLRVFPLLFQTCFWFRPSRLHDFAFSRNDSVETTDHTDGHG
jgi:hypothetical protein